MYVHIAYLLGIDRSLSSATVCPGWVFDARDKPNNNELATRCSDSPNGGTATGARLLVSVCIETQSPATKSAETRNETLDFARATRRLG